MSITGLAFKIFPSHSLSSTISSTSSFFVAKTFSLPDSTLLRILKPRVYLFFFIIPLLFILFGFDIYSDNSIRNFHEFAVIFPYRSMNCARYARQMCTHNPLYWSTSPLNLIFVLSIE